MEGIVEEEGSENETILKKMARKGKSILRRDKTSLSQLEEDLGVGFVKPAVPRPFEEVRKNVFEAAATSWKLDDSQSWWSQEGMEGTMRWKDGKGKEEIEDSQMDEEETIQTVPSKKDLEK